VVTRGSHGWSIQKCRVQTAANVDQRADAGTDSWQSTVAISPLESSSCHARFTDKSVLADRCVPSQPPIGTANVPFSRSGFLAAIDRAASNMPDRAEQEAARRAGLMHGRISAIP
jgi:hypothetical protein